jgi:hypothetical protein
VRQSAVASDSLEPIRAAFERHVGWVECVGHDHEWPEVDDVLEPPSVIEPLDVVSDLTIIGRNLCYRIVAFSDGAFGLIGADADHTEPPRVLIRHEPRWKTLVWFVWLMEINGVRTVWHHRDPLHLKDRNGHVVLSVA